MLYWTAVIYCCFSNSCTQMSQVRSCLRLCSHGAATAYGARTAWKSYFFAFCSLNFSERHRGYKVYKPLEIPNSKYLTLKSFCQQGVLKHVVESIRSKVIKYGDICNLAVIKKHVCCNRWTVKNILQLCFVEIDKNIPFIRSPQIAKKCMCVSRK